MIVTIITTQRFWKDESGNYYRRSGSLRPVLLRSLCSIFDEVRIVARIQNCQLDEVNYNKVDCDNLCFYDIPSFSWPLGFLKNKRKIVAVMEAAISGANVAILRSGPGLPYLGSKIAKTLNVPTISHLIGKDFECIYSDRNRIPFMPLRFLMAWIVHLQMRRVVNSANVKAAVSSDALKVHMRDVSDAVVIPNYCLDTKEFVAPEVHLQNLGDKFQCLYVGRVDMPKNVQTFIRAIHLLPSHVQEKIRVKIVGDGDYLNTLKKLVLDLRLEDKIEFLGWISDKKELRNLYVTSDIVFLLSESEGLPVILGEAAACSVPAIASNRGGIPEFIKDGVNGFVIEPGDHERCKDLLLELSSNIELKKRLSVNAYSAAANFSADKVASRFYDLVKRAEVR